MKVGPFDIPGSLARQWLLLPNPNGRPNSDVLRPWANGQDVTGRPSDTWIIDFAELAESQAALYEVPFEYVKANVKPMRDAGRREGRKRYWWRHGETVPALRRAIAPLSRFIVTSRVSKHRFFAWLPARVLPDSRLYVIARGDDVVSGILSSSIHEVWALANASTHGVGNDPTYNAKSCFETFPFPDGVLAGHKAPTLSSADSLTSIEALSRRLVDLRDSWLNPPEFVERAAEVVSGYPDRVVPKSPKAAEALKTRTMTKLYNLNPTWLQNAQTALDHAVASAYGWEWPCPPQVIVERLFMLNQSRRSGVRKGK